MVLIDLAAQAHLHGGADARPWSVAAQAMSHRCVMAGYLGSFTVNKPTTSNVRPEGLRGST